MIQERRQHVRHGKANYLSGSNPANWHTNISTYRRLIEHTAYPGIDLVYYGTQGRLEYDFVVGSKADPSAIHFPLEGVDKLRVSPEGDLLVNVGGGEVRFHKPVAYQKDGESKSLVAANYVIEDRCVA
jgi:hypothetical protein